MTDKRKIELYDKMVSWIWEHTYSDEDRMYTFRERLGMTEDEIIENELLDDESVIYAFERW